RNVPVTKLAGLIFVLAVMNAEIDLEKPLLIELEICRRVIGWIAANDHEQLDATFIDVSNQLMQRLRLIDRISFNRIRVENSLADVTQRRVHRVGQRMNNGRLLGAGN